jgi:hypothetical protein
MRNKIAGGDYIRILCLQVKEAGLMWQRTPIANRIGQYDGYETQLDCIDCVFIAGMSTSGCVRATAVDSESGFCITSLLCR